MAVAADSAPIDGAANAALYASVSAVAVALIGGVVTVLTTRQRNTPGTPRPDQGDRMEIAADMLLEMKVRADIWEARARRLGWTEDDEA